MNFMCSNCNSTQHDGRCCIGCGTPMGDFNDKDVWKTYRLLDEILEETNTPIETPERDP